MGIPLQIAALLAHEHRQRPFHGRVLQLGRQAILFDRSRFDRFAAEYGLKSKGSPGASGEAVSDIEFFSTLGFDEVESCDVSNIDGATHVFDLNDDPANRGALAGRYDMIFDGGTIEHVFDVRRALMNVVTMLKVGGRAIIFAVSSNNDDHGFYMFCPTLFQDYFAANHFAINEHWLFEYWIGHNFRFLDPFILYRYTPGCIDHLMTRGFGGRQMGIFMVATKTTETTGDVIPMQSYFERLWRDKKAAAGKPPTLASRGGGVSAVKNAFKRTFPHGYIRLVDFYKRFKTDKPPVAAKVSADGVIHWRQKT